MAKQTHELMQVGNANLHREYYHRSPNRVSSKHRFFYKKPKCQFTVALHDTAVNAHTKENNNKIN